jgi:TolA-binding protein
MKKLVVFLCLGLMGCPALQSRNELKTADGRFETSDNSSSRPSRSVAAPARAEAVSDYQNLLEEVRRLNGQVEEMQHKMQQYEQNKNQDSVAVKIDAIEKRLISFSETLLLFEQQMNQKLGASSAAKPSEAKPTNSKSEDPFEKGEALFKKSDWKNAILEFNRYRDNFPKGKNYSEATYKIGVCFQELNMKEEARAFYTEVIEKFPKAKSARSAKYRLNQLKK